MALTTTVLFERPQQEIASLIIDRIGRASGVSIVTGFATPGGLAAIAAPIKARPQCLNTFIVGAATYPGFEALDGLLTAGVPADKLYVHLGHTGATGGRKNPFARFRPMLHSKIYYMELPDSKACAFIGSNNVTSFALTGLNGEASVMLEGPIDSAEFAKVRDHIETARRQAVEYSSDMKEAFAWWTREFIDGLRAEVQLPTEWDTVRTILLFASADKGYRPNVGDYLYYEIPAGIEQLQSLSTKTHLYLFDALPSDPRNALQQASNADAKYGCKTMGAENMQGNREVTADWRIEVAPSPILRPISSGVYRPQTLSGLQQVRVEVESVGVPPFEYVFDRERTGWIPQLSPDEQVHPADAIEEKVAVAEARSNNRLWKGWSLVTGLVPREGIAKEKDEAALKLAAPESGAFILVSLRRRRKDNLLQKQDSE